MDEQCRQNTNKIIELEQRCKSNTRRLDRLEENQTILHEMNKNIAVMAEQTKAQGCEIQSIKSDIQEIKSKPGKRWDQVVTITLTALITAAVAYFITK